MCCPDFQCRQNFYQTLLRHISIAGLYTRHRDDDGSCDSSASAAGGNLGGGGRGERQKRKWPNLTAFAGHAISRPGFRDWRNIQSGFPAPGDGIGRYRLPGSSGFPRRYYPCTASTSLLPQRRNPPAHPQQMSRGGDERCLQQIRYAGEIMLLTGYHPECRSPCEFITLCQYPPGTCFARPIADCAALSSKPGTVEGSTIGRPPISKIQLSGLPSGLR